MILDRTGGMHSLVVSVQIVLAMVWYGLMVLLFSSRGELALERYVLYGVIVAVALGIEFFRRDRAMIRACLFEKSLIKLHPIALRQTGTVLVALVLFVALLKDLTLSRMFLGAYILTLYPVLLLSNRVLPGWFAKRVFDGIREHQTVLIGDSNMVPRLKLWLERRAHLGFVTAGVLCDEETEDSVHGLPVLGGSDEIERVLRDGNISQVIVLGLPLIMHRYSHVLTVCNRYGARLAIYSDLADRLQHPLRYTQDDGLHFLSLRPEPLENPRNRVFKRSLDILVAAPVVLFILPVASLLVWLLQRLQSPGPLFHRQTRAGLQNRRFEIFKFRTMHDRPHDVTRQATAEDVRIYPAGRWLRRFSIDELPQFINVLLGDMSVVGPRPHLVEHNREFARVVEHYHIRAFVRPGITGLAQVRGFRGEATTTDAITARLDNDTFYLENWSLLLDFGIMTRTFTQMFFPPKSAY